MSSVRVAVRTLGELMITAGVVLLLFVAYELWGTNIYTAQQQDQLRHELQQQWAQPPPPAPKGGTRPASINEVPLGDAVAILRIPRLGSGYAKVVVEGVSHEDLKKGPGHYPGTAAPGKVGNFVVSGHRTTYGAPFNRLDELSKGDAVVVETRTQWITYQVRSEEIVDPHDMAVIAPVPDHPGEKPTQAWMTMTTCNPKYSASQRLIVHALLVDTRAKSAGLPPALGG